MNVCLHLITFITAKLLHMKIFCGFRAWHVVAEKYLITRRHSQPLRTVFGMRTCSTLGLDFLC